MALCEFRFNETYTLLVFDDGDGLYDGRFYTIAYEATDSCGNTTENSEVVMVLHDMRNYDQKEVKLPNKPKN